MIFFIIILKFYVALFYDRYITLKKKMDNLKYQYISFYSVYHISRDIWCISMIRSSIKIIATSRICCFIIDTLLKYFNILPYYLACKFQKQGNWDKYEYGTFENYMWTTASKTKNEIFSILKLYEKLIIKSLRQSQNYWKYRNFQGRSERLRSSCNNSNTDPSPPRTHTHHMYDTMKSA